MTTDVRDPKFYAWDPFMKKKFLSEAEIRQYEKMDDSEVGAVFFQVGVQKGAQLFCIMLESYRMAARVANAAWALIERMKKEGTVPQNEEMRQLHLALRDYSPENFSPYTSDAVYAAECFEEFYNEAALLTTKAEVEELLFQWTSRLHALAAVNAGKTSVKEVVAAIRKERDAAE